MHRTPTRQLSWQEWFRRVKRELYDQSKHELRFAQSVLRRVDGLDFANVGTQTAFKDSEGRDRRIDFTISEGENVRLALEVDGWDKAGAGTGMTLEQHRDYTLRERAIVEQGWTLLRFANSEIKDAARCASSIETALRIARAEATLVAPEIEALSATGTSNQQNPVDQPQPRGWLRLRAVGIFAAVLLIGGITAVSQLSAASGHPDFEPECGPCYRWDQAGDAIGGVAVVHGPVAGVRYLDSVPGDPTFVSLGLPYPDEGRFDVVIWSDTRNAFDEPPEDLFREGTVCVEGQVANYGGQLEIVLAAPTDIGFCSLD